MKLLHIVAGLEESNGMANTARQFAAEERAKGYESAVTNDLSALDSSIDVVHLHGAWLPILWRAAKKARRLGVKLVIRPAGSYDPVRRAYHGWKKRLVSFFEHRMLLRADVVLATCQAEVEWIRKYEPRVKKIEVTDLKRFFDLNHETHEIHERVEGRSFHLLYLGRRHPLKGVEFLEAAVKEVESLGEGGQKTGDKGQRMARRCELRIVSNAFGEEKERVWEWCDILVLPTLSENFGRVVAEALERGKRVITTDGAPAWGENLSRVEQVERVEGGEMLAGYGGRLIYLKGYLDGSDEMRVVLLKRAIERVCG